MKPLDIVMTPKGGIAVVQETNDGGLRASIHFIRGQGGTNEKVAWWDKEELTVIDSIPRILAEMCAHPMGNGRRDALRAYRLSDEPTPSDH